MNALARRAVECAGFRWMTGMRDHRGSVACAIAHDGQPLFGQVSNYYAAHRAALPDLDDPATLGCFEHGLLPSVGYNDANLDPGMGKDGETRWFVVYRPDPVSFPGRWLSAVEDGSTTKAGALIAALEAAHQVTT